MIIKKLLIILITVINIQQVFTQNEYSAKCRLNIREKPSVKGKKIGEFKKGDIIDVISGTKTRRKWFKIRYKNNEVYVCGRFVHIEPLVMPPPPAPPRKMPLPTCFYNSSFMSIPVFPGCERFRGRSDKQNCFKVKVRRFFERHFKFKNTRDLKTGNYNVTATFTINKLGKVAKIKQSTKSKTLKKEITRVLYSIPKIRPARFSNESVAYNYKIEIVVVKKSFLSSFFISLFKKQNKRHANIVKIEEVR